MTKRFRLFTCVLLVVIFGSFATLCCSAYSGDYQYGAIRLVNTDNIPTGTSAGVVASIPVGYSVLIYSTSRKTVSQFVYRYDHTTDTRINNWDFTIYYNDGVYFRAWGQDASHRLNVGYCFLVYQTDLLASVSDQLITDVSFAIDSLTVNPLPSYLEFTSELWIAHDDSSVFRSVRSYMSHYLFNDDFSNVPFGTSWVDMLAVIATVLVFAIPFAVCIVVVRLFVPKWGS